MRGSDWGQQFRDLSVACAVLASAYAANDSGSGTPNTKKVGKITREQLEEIAKMKEPDLTAADMDAAVRTIAGTARSMGVDAEV